MANRHAGRIGDLHKHLVLAEVLAAVAPALYCETHAGSAAYPVAAAPAAHAGGPLDPAGERAYGVGRLLDVVAGSPTLAASAYGALLHRLAAERGLLPGSPAVAMAALGTDAEYLLCDLDPDSVADLGAWAAGAGLADRVTVTDGDGMAAVARRVLSGGTGGLATLVHIDPYDPWAVGTAGYSAVDLARALAVDRVPVAYWYGYDRPSQRAWPVEELGGLAPLWCVDLLVTDVDGGTRADGHLGRASTPGTGSGVVVTLVDPAVAERCRAVCEALVEAWHGAPLPSGRAGALSLQVTTR